MNDFDRDFAAGDADAFRTMEEDVQLWHSADMPVAITKKAVVNPGPISSEYRIGGRAVILSLEAEITEAVRLETKVTEGWRLLWNGFSYRITGMRPQGGTWTLICGEPEDRTIGT